LPQLFTPGWPGAALVDLARADPGAVAPGYLVTGAGLRELSEAGERAQMSGFPRRVAYRRALSRSKARTLAQ